MTSVLERSSTGLGQFNHSEKLSEGPIGHFDIQKGNEAVSLSMGPEAKPGKPSRTREEMVEKAMNLLAIARLTDTQGRQIGVEDPLSLAVERIEIERRKAEVLKMARLAVEDRDGSYFDRLSGVSTNFSPSPDSNSHQPLGTSEDWKPDPFKQ